MLHLTLIFCVKSAHATAIVTLATDCTLSVKHEHIWLTYSTTISKCQKYRRAPESDLEHPCLDITDVHMQVSVFVKGLES